MQNETIKHYVCLHLGILCQNDIETYVTQWLDEKFDLDFMVSVADFCFINRITDIKTFNDILEELHKSNILTKDDFLRNCKDLSFLSKYRTKTIAKKETTKNEFLHNQYSSEQIAGIMTNLDEVEV